MIRVRSTELGRPTARLLLVVLLAIPLVGCATGANDIPAGLSDDEAREISFSRFEFDRGLVLEDFPEAQVPDIAIETMAADRAEWSTLQVQCLTEYGMRGVSPTLGGYSLTGPNDPEAEAIAQLACRYRYPIDPRVLGALSAEQAGYAWDYLVGRVVPCMHTLGFQPSPEKPRDEFIEYSSHVWGSVLWSPYGRFEDPFFGPERQYIDSNCQPLPDDPFAVFNGTLTSRIQGEQ